MQLPFYCDYGSNIDLGKRVFFNFNCILLDICQVSSRLYVACFCSPDLHTDAPA